MDGKELPIPSLPGESGARYGRVAVSVLASVPSLSYSQIGAAPAVIGLIESNK